MSQDISFFNPIPNCFCTFVLALLQWLCNRDDMANYIAQKTYTEKLKQSCFLNVGLKHTASGTDPNITPYLFF